MKSGTIHALTAAFASGEASPVAVTEHYLARIGALDAKVGAYLTVTRDEALAAARASEARYRAKAPLGPLDGAPIALKDVFTTRGVRTTCGSKILENFIPPYDATMVTRLKAAGWRTEPPVSVPYEPDASPPATAAAEPPDDPPGTRVRSHGLRVS